MRCAKSRLAFPPTAPPSLKGASLMGIVMVLTVSNAIHATGCVDLAPPWERARATGAGGTAGASGSGGDAIVVDGGRNGTGGMVAVDGTGEAGGDGVDDVAVGTSGKDSDDGMPDKPMMGREAGSGLVDDAAINENDDVALGGGGGAGGYGGVDGGAGGSIADPDAMGSETGGGGTTGTGVMWRTGGAVGSGGVAVIGGTWATGGNPATGGATGTGGTWAMGGAATTGGIVATGGMWATGGSSATGGATGTGGSSSVACSGLLYSGICWYLASSGSSCTQACTGHGGPATLAAGHVGTAAQGGSLSECATLLSLLGVAGTVQGVESISGVGCSKNTGTMGPGPGLYWCTSPDFSPTASLSGVQPACGCLQ